MKKILLINPWGVNNDVFYTSGLTSSLNKFTELDLATNYYYEGNLPNGKLYKLFFRRTEKYKGNNVLRKIIRGMEYAIAYKKLIKIIRNGKYDCVHIQWLLMYKLDIVFLKKIKQLNAKVVLTAHNALPHVDAEKYLNELDCIYRIVDMILVHGEAIKQEMLSVFPLLESKITIQPHGAVLHRKIARPQYTIEPSIIEKTNNKEIYIMFGNQFYNKGTDRLLKIWRNNYINDDKKLLVIAGRRTNTYPELDHEMKHITNEDNVLFLDKYIDDELLEYLILHSEAILLPYRHASMSGVVFTAAEYQTMILTTMCGAISEYLVNGQDSILVKNTDEDFAVGLQMLMTMPHEKKVEYGKQLYKNINEKYSWDSIAQLLLKDVYQ